MSKGRRRAQAARRVAAARQAHPTLRAVMRKRPGHAEDCTRTDPHFVPPGFGMVGFFTCNVPEDITNHSRKVIDDVLHPAAT